QVGNAAFLAEIVDLHDVRVIEPRRCVRLANEAPGEVLRRLLVELADVDGLDRDLAAELRVEGLVDDAHRSLAEHALDPVATQGGGTGHGAGVSRSGRTCRRRRRSRSR